MFYKRAHILEPSTELTGKGKFVWEDLHEKTFLEMKAILASNCLNTYPDLNKPFDIVSNTSDYQLGACILQEGRPIAYYS